MVSKEELLLSFREKKEKEIVEYDANLTDMYNFLQNVKCFEDQIIEKNLTGKERNINFGNKFKDISLSWGINRRFYENSKSITNCKKEVEDKYLTSVYINTLSQYDLYEEFDLYKSLSDVNIFFGDELNTTFYIEDEHLEEFLEALNKWYIKAVVLAKRIHCENKIKKLKKQLEEETERYNELSAKEEKKIQ